MLPPTTARDVHTVCPNDAPTATPIAFLCVASCMEITEVKKLCKIQIVAYECASSYTITALNEKYNVGYIKEFQ
jgi:hypothetical protein